MARSKRPTRILSEEERHELLRQREKKKRFRQIKAPARQGPQLVPFLLSLLAIAVVLFHLFGPDLDLGLDFLDSEEIEGLDVDGESEPEPDVRRDPAAFREMIERFEARLFAPNLADQQLSDFAESLAADLDGLAIRFRAEGNETFDDAAMKLEAASAEIADRVTLRRLESLRGEWTRLRGDLFRPADWFRFGTSGGDTRREVIALAVYRQSAEDVLALVEEALGEVESILSTRAPDDEQQADMADAWSEFAADWHERLDGLRAEAFPRPDSSAPDAHLLVVQDYEQRVRGVADWVAGSRLPDESTLRTLESAQVDWRQLVSRFDELIDG